MAQPYPAFTPVSGVLWAQDVGARHESLQTENGLRRPPMGAARWNYQDEGVTNELREALNMNPSMTEFQLRFQSLFDPGRGYAFPCDEQGHVDLDALSEKARNNYLYARAMI